MLLCLRILVPVRRSSELRNECHSTMCAWSGVNLYTMRAFVHFSLQNELRLTGVSYNLVHDDFVHMHTYLKYVMTVPVVVSKALSYQSGMWPRYDLVHNLLAHCVHSSYDRIYGVFFWRASSFYQIVVHAFQNQFHWLIFGLIPHHAYILYVIRYWN
jgi:hypothetical protein